MDINDRLNSLPDAIRRKILHAVCNTNSRAPAAGAILPDTLHQGTEVQPGTSHEAPLGLKLVGGACVLDDFIDQRHVKEARACAVEALAEGHQQAAIGGAIPLPDAGRQIDTQARGDRMRWLSLEREEAGGPGRAALAALLRRMEGVRHQLERQGYDVGGRPTYQLACYPGGGSRYVRHADASISCPTRTLTAIVYLNEPDWDPQVDGGCLALYNVPYSGRLAGAGVGAGEPATLVAPSGGRLLVFESHLFHEVLPAHRHRYAVTAWFHRRPPAAAPAAAASSLPFSSPAPAAAADGVCTAAAAPHTGNAASAASVQGVATIAQALPGANPAGGDAPTAAPTSLAAGEQAEGDGSGSGGNASAAVLLGSGEAAVAAAPAAIPAAAGLGTSSPCPSSSSGSRSGGYSNTDRTEAQGSGKTGVSCKDERNGSGGSTERSANGNSREETGNSCGGASGSAASVAASASAAAASSARIFVSIAAYRDPECQWTLHSLFSEATHPERVRVGVVWQAHPVEDAAFVRVAGARSHPEWLDRVRQVVLPHGDAAGPCKARSLAQALWCGEEYVLQLDSHMRMVTGWDVRCIQQLTAAEALSTTGKAVLSTYPLGYEGCGPAAEVPDEATAPATLLCARGFGEEGFLRTSGRVLRERPARPLPSLFWAAGLSFSRATWMQEVPYCPHLPHLFFGEEPYMLARMWCRGWDVFAPSLPLAFHQWERSARQHTYQRDHAAAATSGGRAAAGANGMAVATGATEALTAATQPPPADGRAGPATVADGGGEAGSDATAEAGVKKGGTPDVADARRVAELRRRSQARVLGVLCGASKVSRPPPPPPHGAFKAAHGEACQVAPLAVLGGAEAASGGGRGDGSGGDGGCGGGCGWPVGHVWGLGTERSLAEFQQAIGVDLIAMRVTTRAEWGGQAPEAFAP